MYPVQDLFLISDPVYFVVHNRDGTTSQWHCNLYLTQATSYIYDTLTMVLAPTIIYTSAMEKIHAAVIAVMNLR